MNDVLLIVYFVAALVPAVVLHEVSHGWIADRFGDKTARFQGRLSLNPLKHVDPFGSVILPGFLILLRVFAQSGVPVFGYAKPVPVNPARMGRPRRDMMLVALGGPATNLALALIGTLAARLTGSVVALGGSPLPVGQLGVFLFIWVLINVILAVFNLFPIPPLDGSKVLAFFLPPRAAEVFRSWEQYGALFMLAIFFVLPGPLLGFVEGLQLSMFRLLLG